MQIFDAGEGRSRFVWIADLLPDAAADDIGMLIDRALAVIEQTLEFRLDSASRGRCDRASGAHELWDMAWRGGL